MAGASFKMDTTAFEKMLKKSISHLNEAEDLMACIGEAWVSSTKERFEDGVDPDGEPWEESQRVQDSGGQTLVKDSHLKKSINYEASSTMVAVGTSNEVYGAIHQFGGADAGKPEIVARPYIGANEEDMAEAKEMVSEFMQEGFGL